MGVGAHQTSVNNAQCGSRVVFLAVGHIGDTLGREIEYLGRNHILSTHLGCFCAPVGAEAGGRANDNAFQKSVLPN